MFATDFQSVDLGRCFDEFTEQVHCDDMLANDPYKICLLQTFNLWICDDDLTKLRKKVNCGFRSRDYSKLFVIGSSYFYLIKYMHTWPTYRL